MPADGAPSATADRVVVAHRQTRRGLVVTAAFTAAAVVAAVVPHRSGAWLPLHLFLLGALTSAAMAVTVMLAVTWSAAPAPPDRTVLRQRALFVVGVLGIVGGREADSAIVIELGGTAVVVALLWMVPILTAVRHRATTPRFVPAIEAYEGAFVMGAIGTILAVTLAAGRMAARYDDLRDAHLTLNLYGLVGLIIAGTLPFFSATLVRRRTSTRATASTVRAVVVVLAAAALAAAAGELFALPGLTVVGLAAYGVTLAIVVAALLPVWGRRQWTWAGPRLVQLLTGLGWWIALTMVLAVVVATGDGDDRAVLRALVTGGYAQILVASLAYLGPVLRGGPHPHLSAGFRTTRSWISVIAGNAAAVALLLDATTAAGILLVVWLADIAARAVRLATATRPESS